MWNIYFLFLAISTAAIEMLAGSESTKYSRKPEIVADAAYYILNQDPKSCTGNFFIDEEVVKKAGITDLKQYACVPENHDKLMPDFFVDDNVPEALPGVPSLTEHANKKVAKPVGDIANLFKTIESTLSSETVAKTQAIFEFNVTGDEAGKWYIDLKTGNGACGQGSAPSSPDATLTMDSKNFFNMFSGKLKPATAYMMGKLKITGNLQKALKLEKLMTSLKAKL
ncbi:hypothetical protein NQ314_012914 [Rhamnusium bicolor]|uniref:SCP2 domain-containing protein n=1 Tax=Rhamnusium bicolor TaxID=1586634 RepID=A0AAV8X9J2_9CUCU|nr:hypothetical protein NQ314_012914 [Rhamnusium bicolor]